MAFEPHTTEAAVTELYRRVRITAGSRFNASRRLELHGSLAIWTVAIASCMLLVIPLLQALDVPVMWSPAQLNALQVLLAVLVLVVSLVLGSKRFGARAVEMHRSARLINAIERQLHPSRTGSLTFADVDRLDLQYTHVLEASDNHEPIDFERHRLYARVEYYDHKHGEYFRHLVQYLWRCALEYGIYVLVLVGLLWGIAGLVGALR